MSKSKQTSQVQEVLEEVACPKQSRRELLTAMGVSAVAGATMLSLPKMALAATVRAAADTTSISDTDILNFALNLEYLEAEFYSYATSGQGIGAFGIATNGEGKTGPTTGQPQVNFHNDPVTTTVANQIAVDERTHVTLIRSTIISLGGTPVAKPAINLAALGVANTVSKFLVLARAFEDTGVSAYGGAAPLISDKTVLGYAARILAVETYHASNLRLQLALNDIPSFALDSMDVPPPPTGSFYFDAKNALAVVRTPQQVLAIVYGGAGKTSGGFFPEGVNGAITSS